MRLRYLKKYLQRVLYAIAIFIGLLFIFATHFANDPVLNSSAPPKKQSCEKGNSLISPPKISGPEFAKQLQFIERHIQSDQMLPASDKLSALIQMQIGKIQSMDCTLPNLQCGHQGGCGLGCQMHHRIACLIMSYVTQLPLIHTVDCDAWTFTDPWTHVFQSLGSTCAPGNNTIVWIWTGEAPFLMDCVDGASSIANSNILGKTMPFPLVHGIPLDSRLASLIEAISPDPFLWFVGQFAKYAMRYDANFEARLTGWKGEIGFDRQTPIVGIHVRRSDKIIEGSHTHHPLPQYLAEAEKYFQELESFKGLPPKSLPRRVFVASEDSSILARVVQMYPTWEVLGFRSKFSERARKHGLLEIARDIEFLRQSDFVICGFSSNVCELVYELQDSIFSEDFSSSHQLLPLDADYYFNLFGHSLLPHSNMKIRKVNC